jgi:hypothetical protein
MHKKLLKQIERDLDTLKRNNKSLYDEAEKNLYRDLNRSAFIDMLHNTANEYRSKKSKYLQTVNIDNKRFKV